LWPACNEKGASIELRLLPFVAEVVERYAYLRPDEGLEETGW